MSYFEYMYICEVMNCKYLLILNFVFITIKMILYVFLSFCISRQSFGLVSMVIQLLVILMLVFSLVMLYRVTYVIVLSLLVLTVTEFLTGFSGYRAQKAAAKPKTE